MTTNQFTHTKRKLPSLLAALAIAAGGLGLTTLPAAPAAAADLTVLDSGHVDAFNVTAEGDSLKLDLKEDVTGAHVRRAPESVLLKVKSAAYKEDIPAGVPGAPAGYLLPLTQDPQLLWPGWDTLGVSSNFGKIDIDIAVKGPGKVHLFTSGTFGGVTPLLKGGKTELPGTIENTSPAHTHANWVFSAAGRYTFTVTASGVPNAGGEVVRSNTATYTWVVGPDAISLSGAEGKHAAGDKVKVTATPNDPGKLSTYRWETRESAGDAPGKWTVLEGETGPTATVTAAPGLQVRASLLNEAGTVAVTSEPAELEVSKPEPTPGTPTPGTPTPGTPTPGTPTPGTPTPGTPTPGTPTPDTRLVLDSGHTDVFNIVPAGDGIALNLKEDVTGSHVTHKPEDVLLKVKPSALTDIPAGFPGGGAKGYLLPLTQQADLLWPGWDSLPLIGSPHAGPAYVDILNVTGPGTIHLFTMSTVGKPVSLMADNKFDLPGTITIPEPAHVHANWIFSAEGEYTLTVRARVGAATSDMARAAAAGAVTSETHTYTFHVGNVTAPDPGNTPVVTPPVIPPSTPGQPPTETPAAAENICLPTPVTTTVTEEAPAAPAIPRSAATSGHFDIGAVLEDGQLVPMIKDDRNAPAKWVTPSSLTFGLGDAARRKAPAGIEFIANQGSDIWMIGSTQEAGVPWVGANTQHESIVNGTTGPVTWHLDSVSGPGKLAMFLSGPFGGGVGQRQLDNVGGPRTFTVNANTHQHGNWVFTAPGQYSIRITQTATLKGGGEVSGTSTLRFYVGGSESATPGAPITREVTEIVGRDAHGNPCELSEDVLKEARRAAGALANTGLPAGSMMFGALTLLGAGVLLTVNGRRRAHR